MKKRNCAFRMNASAANCRPPKRLLSNAPKHGPASKIQAALRNNEACQALLSRITSRLSFRPYQQFAFDNRTNGIECWLWGRQTGKSFTLASWAIDRLITRPGRL